MSSKARISNVAARAPRRLAAQATIARLDSVTPRHAAVLSQIWFGRGLSRSDLHARTGTRLRTIGSLVEDLVAWGLVEEGSPRVTGVGRPQVPLAIAKSNRSILGLSMMARRVIVVRSGLTCEAFQPPLSLAVKEGDDLVGTAARLVREYSDSQTLAIGVGLTGFVDTDAGDWLLSSAHPSDERVSLKPLLRAAGNIPVSINNELHAMSAAAKLAGRLPRGDSLLVHIEDGRIAASILVNGKPNRGSVLAANELGHTTMPVDIARCYCGRVGCIERIFSSDYLTSQGCSKGLAQVLAGGLRSNKIALKMIDLLCRAVANAINFVRPARLILSCPYSGHREFVVLFEELLVRHTLNVLHQRLNIEWQLFDPDRNALAAAALPLAGILEEPS